MFKLLLLSVLSLFLFGFVGTNNFSKSSEFRNNEVIVKFKDQMKSPVGLSIKSTRSFSHIENLNLLVLDNKVKVKDAIEILNKDPNVLYAEPNYIYRALDEQVIPNDPRFGDLWGHINTKTPGADIAVAKAWSLTTGSSDVVVAVIDTGVDYTHPDLKENIWVNEDELKGEAGVDDDGNGYVDDIHGWDFANSDADPMDDNNHGTHCAGIIGASGNNGMGVAGINWNVRIMPLKFLEGSGNGTLEGAVRSVEYAIDNGAHIISNSWGATSSSRTLDDVFALADKHGLLTVAASGNTNTNSDLSGYYPASIDVPSMISVASTDDEDKLSPFSCYGLETVDLGAPGSAILSTIIGNRYGYNSGTSMATPYVAGAAALLKAYEPELNSVEIKDRLMKTVDKLSSLKKFVKSQGRLNVYNALMDIVPTPPWPYIDPEEFLHIEKNISTPHPYDKYYTKEWEIKNEGAKFMILHFSNFETERKLDNVKLYDADDNLVETYFGKMGSFWSDIIVGDKIRIVFSSDRSIQKYGFDIDKYGVIY